MTNHQQLFEGKQFVAKTISGLEEVLAEELRQLNAPGVEILNRAVSFGGDKRLLYKVNYWSRTALRVLVPVFSFQMADEDDLYSNIYNYPWEELMDVTQTLAIDSVVSESELTHSHYVALRSKDAIVDRFRERNNGRRPSVDVDDPDIRINIHIFGNQCDVSLDSSGISLHKRGYRVSNAEAPMSEVLAAGLILLSGWDKQSHFIDPMCGSGTLLIEAALIANNFPPGLYRKSFGFMRWNSFDPALWEEILMEAQDLQTEFEFEIIGNDISARNLGAAKANIKSARLHKDIQLVNGPFSDLKPPQEGTGVLVVNPPYGERIKTSDIIGLYKEIGDTFKKNYAGYKAWVISSDQYALKSVGLKASRKLIVWNGPLECRFAGFDLYVGTKKQLFPDNQESEKSSDTDSDVPVDIPEGQVTETKPFEKKFKPGNRQPERENRKPAFAGKGFNDRKKTGKPFGKEEKGNRRDFKKDDFRPGKTRTSDRDDSGKSFRRKNDRDGFESQGKSFKKDDSFRSKDRPAKTFRSDDHYSKPDRPFKERDKRTNDRPDQRRDKSFRRETGSEFPGSSFGKRPGKESTERHDNHPPSHKKKDVKEVEIYQPQNRFGKPEKTYRSKDGKVNEGKKATEKTKEKRPPRPRKDRK